MPPHEWDDELPEMSRRIVEVMESTETRMYSTTTLMLQAHELLRESRRLLERLGRERHRNDEETQTPGGL